MKLEFVFRSFFGQWISRKNAFEIHSSLEYHTVQNGRVILDKLPSTFDT